MAVYTHLPTHEIEALLEAYDIGELTSALGIAEGVENSNYLLVTEKDGTETKYILTIFEKRVNPDDLPFYIGLMEHLAKKQIPCPLPVKNKTGDMIGHTNEGKPFTIVSFLTGRSLRHTSNLQLRELGVMTAKLHLAAKDYSGKRANALSLAGWRRLFEKTAERADEVQAGIAPMLAQELHYLMDSMPVVATVPTGVVHADLFPDNVFFLHDQLSGVIDFYFACNDTWAYDLAIVMNAWCFETTDWSFNVTKARHLLQGYEQIRKLTEEEKRYFPTLARAAAIRFLLTRLHDWLYPVEGALVTPKSPQEYIKKLQFHQQFTNFSEYGL